MGRPSGTAEIKLSLAQLQAAAGLCVIPEALRSADVAEMFYRFSEGPFLFPVSCAFLP